MDVSEATMQCMEVWGGNTSTYSHFEVPGLDLWIYSEPHGADHHGGDVYYISSCASGRTTRMLIGDVSGHGEEASETAHLLKSIMRENVNFINHSRLVNSINREFEAVSSPGRFATAVIGTFFLPTGQFMYCNAGHPPPARYDSQTGHWEKLSTSDDDMERNQLPFGIDTAQEYGSNRCRLNQGDFVLCYTDAIFEARDQSDNQLGSAGLLELLNTIENPGENDFIRRLLKALRELNQTNLTQDDVTLLLAKRTSKRVSLRDEFFAPFRFIGDLVGLKSGRPIKN